MKSAVTSRYSLKAVEDIFFSMALYVNARSRNVHRTNSSLIGDGAGVTDLAQPLHQN